MDIDIKLPRHQRAEDIDLPVPRLPDSTQDTLTYQFEPDISTPDYQYDPLTYFFEREDGYQYLVWVWNDGTVLHAERRNSSEIWSPPITGEKR